MFHADKVKGALYGFAIGDAMGATTEFLHKETIERLYPEKLKDIIGGGWLNCKPGEVTDDTEMTLCVCDAICNTYVTNNKVIDTEKLLSRCCENFIEWFSSHPKDVGCCCSNVISTAGNSCVPSLWHKIADNPDSLGNGSLMRTMPIVLCKLGEETAIQQGRLTHNNKVCDDAIVQYYRALTALLDGFWIEYECPSLYEPTGHILNTLNNAIYWVQNTESFEEAIIGAVNDGGDADTIAAITGSLAGAYYGFQEIPKRWIDKLDPKIKKILEIYLKIFEKVCTNN